MSTDDKASTVQGEVRRDWPPRFDVTPEGAAAMFLMMHCRGANVGKEAQMALAELLKGYWRGGYDSAKRGDARA